MSATPIVTIFVRHSADCKYAGDEFCKRCNCRKHFRWTQNGEQFRRKAGTRSWAEAEERKRRLEDHLTGRAPEPQPEETRRDTRQALQTFIIAKKTENLSEATIRKLRYQLGQFVDFMENRSKLFPAEITSTDVIEFRASWTWKSGLTRQKAQQNLRGFLRSCCGSNLTELLAALSKIKLTKADKTRLEPQPFTEKELKHLLDQVPKTFPDVAKAARMTALIHCMVSTGLAIRDTVQLQRASIADGWLRIDRQKTDRSVRQKLDAGLHRELLSVANGNPKYIFWNGSSKPTSAVGLWQTDLRELMNDARLWIKGNLSHRFRDTAVDFWLGAGCNLTDIAAMLGDTVTIVEKHYANLASKRMEERLSKMPARSWE